MNQKEKNLALANDIKDFLIKNNLAVDVRIYFNNTCYDWCDGDHYFKEPKILEDIKSTDYFEYGNNDTVSMSFEGDLYDILNYGDVGSLENEFYNIFKKHGCYFEFGYAWSLSVYY